MYDSGKIIPGLAVFVLLITFPIWYNNLVGNVGAAPINYPNPSQEFDANFPNSRKHPPADEMRATHMNLLQEFHAAAKGYDAAKDGQKPTMSCLGCHGTKEQFCDSCHAYASVKTPDCWTCHTNPNP
ncbi:cytochrome C [Candidatus Electronema sp. PJ]|uniref:cytochrome C n=1 Tax=Candidatus Electronema sp. PJ TaxID=3401572 RepID=UPI003AA86E47